MLGEAYHKTSLEKYDEQSAEGRTHLVETMNELTRRTEVGGHDGSGHVCVGCMSTLTCFVLLHT